MIKHSQLRLSAIDRLIREGFNLSKNISYRDLAGIINQATGWGNVLKKSKKQVYKNIISRFCAENPSLNIGLSSLKRRKLTIVKTKNNKFVQSNDFLSSPEWRRTRYDALKKNNGCCELCGRSKMDGIVLNVDHIKPRRKYPKLALNIDNLQVLCNECNHGKGNRDDTDWRDDSFIRDYKLTV